MGCQWTFWTIFRVAAMKVKNHWCTVKVSCTMIPKFHNSCGELQYWIKLLIVEIEMSAWGGTNKNLAATVKSAFMNYYSITRDLNEVNMNEIWRSASICWYECSANNLYMLILICIISSLGYVLVQVQTVIHIHPWSPKHWKYWGRHVFSISYLYSIVLS